MNSPIAVRVLSPEEAASLPKERVVEMSHSLVSMSQSLAGALNQVEILKQQLEWFRRQIFGQKSERHIALPPSAQMSLGEGFDSTPESAPEKTRTVAGYSRAVGHKSPESRDETLPFFDDSRVPVEVIDVLPEEIKGLPADAYEVIGHKDTYRLAQRPGSYVVLNYRRAVVKLREAPNTIVCHAAPVGVIEGSRADVSLIAGVMIDKFAYHLPLYRQHQRMGDSGITVSRPWLTHLVQDGASLMEPVYEAQFDSVRASRVIAMDETPIKAGRAGPGKMKGAYFWPIYGQDDEVCFPFFESRRHEHVHEALGELAPGTILLSDGYEAYTRYAEKTKITQALCWVHARRHFFDALKMEPEKAAHALDLIGELYKVEAHIRQMKLKAERKVEYRLMHAQPFVKEFFAWVDKELTNQGLLPTNPLTSALAYAWERRLGLEVYLNDADVPMDTNHLERALRAIPMGRRNWLFSWTELGAKHVGIVQSLIVTCRLHKIDPYTYLVDVLQRVGQHPAARVHELTPRLWKQHFAANPLRSDLHNLTAKSITP